MSNVDFDVIIVGAGFSGLIAARELQQAGLSYTVVEAKDRIGGRAWTDERMGYPLELGATWVHWQQPHVWAEITRYGQGIVASPKCEDGFWVSGGEAHQGTEEQLGELLARPQAKILEGGRELFPQPYEPLMMMDDPEIREKLLAFDQESIMDLLDPAEFSQEERDVVNGYWSSGCQGDVFNSSSLMAKHWGALTDYRIDLFDEQTIGFKLQNGMRGLYENMAKDLKHPVRLNTPVTKIEHTKDHVIVHYVDGSSETARDAIVTVPLGALKNIEFQPPLDSDKERLIDEGWNTTGFKIWIKLRGHHKFFGLAPKPNTCAFIRSEYFLDDDTTICVAFGPDRTNVDLESVAAAQEMVNQWRDDVEVVDCTGHDWGGDQWAGQTWATLKKGQFTNGWHHFSETQTALNFAGADWANGWRGICVDGALESGLKQARAIIARLRDE